MTQTAEPTVLDAIIMYGSRAAVPIDALREALPDSGPTIDQYVKESDHLIRLKERRTRKRRDVDSARQALAGPEFPQDTIERLRCAAEDPASGRPLDTLYDLVKGMAAPEQVPAVEVFFVAALIYGHTLVAIRETTSRMDALRQTLAVELDVL